MSQRRGVKRPPAARAYPKLRLSPAKAAFSATNNAAAVTPSVQPQPPPQQQQHSPPPVPWSVAPPPKRQRGEAEALRLTFTTSGLSASPTVPFSHIARAAAGAQLHSSAAQASPIPALVSAAATSPAAAAAAASSSLAHTAAATSSPAVAAAPSFSSTQRASWHDDPAQSDDVDWPDEDVLLEAYRPMHHTHHHRPAVHVSRMTLQLTSTPCAQPTITRPTATRTADARPNDATPSHASLDSTQQQSNAQLPLPSSPIDDELAVAATPDTASSAASSAPSSPAANATAAPVHSILTPPLDLQPPDAATSVTPPNAASPSPPPSPQRMVRGAAAATEAAQPAENLSSLSFAPVALAPGRRSRRPSLTSQLQQLSAVTEGDEERIEESQQPHDPTQSQLRDSTEAQGDAAPSSARDVSPARQSGAASGESGQRADTPSAGAAAAPRSPSTLSQAAAGVASAAALSQPSQSSQRSSSSSSSMSMPQWQDDFPSLSYIYSEFPGRGDDDETAEREFQQLAQNAPALDDGSDEASAADCSSQQATQVMAENAAAVVSSQMATQQLPPSATPAASFARTQLLPQHAHSVAAVQPPTDAAAQTDAASSVAPESPPDSPSFSPPIVHVSPTPPMEPVAANNMRHTGRTLRSRATPSRA